MRSASSSAPLAIQALYAKASLQATGQQWRVGVQLRRIILAHVNTTPSIGIPCSASLTLIKPLLAKEREQRVTDQLPHRHFIARQAHQHAERGCFSPGGFLPSLTQLGYELPEAPGEDIDRNILKIVLQEPLGRGGILYVRILRVQLHPNVFDPTATG